MNVFLARDNFIRIGDLGVAKILDSTNAYANSVVGTPYYLSPELCEDKPYNSKSDIWALGCITYEMCTLKHPFDATNQAALIMKIVRSKYESIPGVFSLELRSIVEKMLNKDCK